MHGSVLSTCSRSMLCEDMSCMPWFWKWLCWSACVLPPDISNLPYRCLSKLVMCCQSSHCLCMLCDRPMHDNGRVLLPVRANCCCLRAGLQHKCAGEQQAQLLCCVWAVISVHVHSSEVTCCIAAVSSTRTSGAPLVKKLFCIGTVSLAASG